MRIALAIAGVICFCHRDGFPVTRKEYVLLFLSQFKIFGRKEGIE
jgi:hypothetical protein